MDVMQACRCCLRCPPDKDLTTPYTHLGKREIYVDMLKDCFDLHLILDGAGSCGICSACVGRLRDASDFKLQVQHCQAELQATVLIKVEPEIKSELMEGPDEDPTFDVLNEVPIEKTEMASEDETEKAEDPLTNAEKSAKLTSNQSVAGSSSVSARADEHLVEKRTNKQNKEKPHACDICRKCFKTASSLKKHKHFHSSPLFNDLACGLCNSTFQAKFLLLEHQNSEHGVTRFMCAQCDYTTVCKRSLTNHIMIHTGYIFRCNSCNFTSQDRDIFQRHRISHKGQKAFKCSHCKYESSRKSEMERHQRIHSGEKPYSCSFCDYKSTDKGNLRRHVMTHTKSKPFKCNECDYSCSRKEVIEKHKTIHTGEKPFACDSCDFKCRYQANLRRHQLLHTDVKLFECNRCDYKCNQKGRLRDHQRVHTGEKLEQKYECTYCDFRCGTKTTLVVHVRKHTGEKPFACNYCDYNCRDKSGLRSHLKRHNKDTNLSDSTP